MSKRPNRSDKYQYLILESVCSNDMMEAFCNEDSISSKLNPYQYSEELLDLEEQLRVEFWRIVDTMLTERQRQVIRLAADGYTQMEIAKILNVNQSSITKSLNGNVDYKGGNNSVKMYGGSKKKLHRIIEKDPKILEIFRQMNEIREKKW